MKHFKKIIMMLFFISGISGLMYEVVWVRMYSRIIGSTNYAIAIVLASFMGGLAAGSLLFGRVSDKGKNNLKLFAILELAIGLVSLLVTITLPLFGPLYKVIYQVTGEASGVSFVIRALLLSIFIFIPSTLMGGTLPVLVSYLSKKYKEFGKDLSLLYGLNTLGAVFGVLLTGYITLGALGERKTVLIGFILNLFVSCIALFLNFFEKDQFQKKNIPNEKELEKTPCISTYSDNIRRCILALIFFSGVTALAYEVIWSRQLILYLKTSIYAFSMMLSIFLAGIALGSMSISCKIEKIRNPLYVLGAFEIIIGILSIMNVYLFVLLDESIFLKTYGSILSTMIIIMPMTFFFGAAFPLASLAFTKTNKKTGTSVGLLYGFNTMGNIIGSLLGGFFLIPFIGSSRSIIILGLSNLLIGGVLIFLDKKKGLGIRIVFLTAVAAVFLLVAGLRSSDPFLDLIVKKVSTLASRYNKPYKIYYNEEGVQGTTTSFEIGTTKLLCINGINMTRLCSDTKLMAHLPVMLSPKPEEILIICFGMGTTARSASLYNNLKVTTVEIMPEVYDCFKYFHPDAEKVFKRDNLDIITGDGRNYLFLTERKFDIITIDPSPPIWSQGTVNLYSKEFFILCKKHLTPQGIMCLWFPGQATENEVKAVLHAFSEVFPKTNVWTGINGWGFYFIGMPENLEIREENFKKFFENPVVRDDLLEFKGFDRTCQNSEQLLGLFMWNDKEVKRQIKGFPIVTDDFPYTEFPIWRHSLKDFQSWHPEDQLKYINNIKSKE